MDGSEESTKTLSYRLNFDAIIGFTSRERADCEEFPGQFSLLSSSRDGALCAPSGHAVSIVQPELGSGILQFRPVSKALGGSTSSSVVCTVLSACGRFLAVCLGSPSLSLSVWFIPSEPEVSPSLLSSTPLGSVGPALSMCFSPDALMLVFVSESLLCAWPWACSASEPAKRSSASRDLPHIVPLLSAPLPSPATAAPLPVLSCLPVGSQSGTATLRVAVAAGYLKSYFITYGIDQLHDVVDKIRPSMLAESECCRKCGLTARIASRSLSLGDFENRIIVGVSGCDTEGLGEKEVCWVAVTSCGLLLAIGLHRLVRWVDLRTPGIGLSCNWRAAPMRPSCNVHGVDSLCATPWISASYSVEPVGTAEAGGLSNGHFAAVGTRSGVVRIFRIPDLSYVGSLYPPPVMTNTVLLSPDVSAAASGLGASGEARPRSSWGSPAAEPRKAGASDTHVPQLTLAGSSDPLVSQFRGVVARGSACRDTPVVSLRWLRESGRDRAHIVVVLAGSILTIWNAAPVIYPRSGKAVKADLVLSNVVHEGIIWGVTECSNGLLTVGDDGTMKYWRKSTAEVTAAVPYSGLISWTPAAIAVVSGSGASQSSDSPHGLLCVAASTPPVTDVGDARAPAIIAVGERSGVVSLWELQVWCKHGRALAARMPDFNIVTWFPAHSAEVLSLAFSPYCSSYEPDSLSLLVSASRDRHMHLFTVLRHTSASGQVTTVAQHIRTIAAHSGSITRALFSPRFVQPAGMTAAVMLYLTSVGTDSSLLTHTISILPPDSDAEGVPSAHVTVMPTAELSLAGYTLCDLANYSDDTKAVVLSSKDVCIVDVGSASVIQRFSSTASANSINSVIPPGSSTTHMCVAISSPAGLGCVLSSDCAARLFDLSTGAIFATALVHTDVPTSAHFVAASEEFVSVGGDGLLVFWKPSLSRGRSSLGRTDLDRSLDHSVRSRQAAPFTRSPIRSIRSVSPVVRQTADLAVPLASKSPETRCSKSPNGPNNDLRSSNATNDQSPLTAATGTHEHQQADSSSDDEFDIPLVPHPLRSSVVVQSFNVLHSPFRGDADLSPSNRSRRLSPDVPVNPPDSPRFQPAMDSPHHGNHSASTGASSLYVALSSKHDSPSVLSSPARSSTHGLPANLPTPPHCDLPAGPVSPGASRCTETSRDECGGSSSRGTSVSRTTLTSHFVASAVKNLPEPCDPEPTGAELSASPAGQPVRPLECDSDHLIRHSKTCGDHVLCENAAESPVTHNGGETHPSLTKFDVDIVELSRSALSDDSLHGRRESLSPDHLRRADRSDTPQRSSSASENRPSKNTPRGTALRQSSSPSISAELGVSTPVKVVHSADEPPPTHIEEHDVVPSTPDAESENSEPSPRPSSVPLRVATPASPVNTSSVEAIPEIVYAPSQDSLLPDPPLNDSIMSSSSPVTPADAAGQLHTEEFLELHARAFVAHWKDSSAREVELFSRAELAVFLREAASILDSDNTADALVASSPVSAQDIDAAVQSAVSDRVMLLLNDDSFRRSIVASASAILSRDAPTPL